jgi:hypothetical protein
LTECFYTAFQNKFNSYNKMNCELKITYDTPAYMFNVYKNQLSRQAGSRNLTGPKTLPTIWHTYLKLVTKYQISAINSCCEKCDEKHRGLTEAQTEGRTEVKQYTPLRWSGGIKIQHKCKMYERNIPGNIQRIKFQSSCKHMQPSCPATRTGN